jgi:subtilisin family serine protease
MPKKFIPFFVAVSAAALSIGVVHVVNNIKHSHGIDESFIDEGGNLVEPIDIATHTEHEVPKDKYEEGAVLVKTPDEIDISKLDIKVSSYKELYPNSLWKKMTVKETTSFEAVQYLRNTNLFEKVDYNYIMETEDEYEPIDVSGNEFANDLPYIESNGIGHAWAWGHYKHDKDNEEVDAGGSPDVVIAIIDTGVDYNHVDLRDNIWTNTAEIPNNNVDDDGNGYIDDVHGWDCVNEDKDPMDDNGHGTRVAGIAAAQNNNIGTVGVAFNSKIMPIKAGTSTGSFTNDDITQAIQYAYMNGASVINMSFGGTSMSIAVQDALSNAYNQCVLVAAAGNNGMCNQPGCPQHEPFCAPFYPASIPYVVGVMSCNADGTVHSSFSNFDHYAYNEFEYDCYACGEQVISTWPGNKYARLSGTSMASPVVAGIAALVRGAYPDREAFSTKYIHSQLTNAGTLHPSGDIYHPVCDAYEALTNIPTPHIYNLYKYYAFDNTEFSPNNNGDGFIDAGETIRLGIELQNRGGKAKNVTARIDTIRNGDPNLTDPNVTILTDTVHMDNIGTYSIQDGGKIYDGDKVVDMTEAFDIQINPNTQNGYYCSFNLHIEYNNGLDNSDHTLYYGDCTFGITINRGYRISGIINEDTVFTADKSYIIDGTVTIPEGVTVAFEPGCLIEFYSNNAGYIDTLYNSPIINVYGSLLIQGTKDNMVTLRPSSNFSEYCYFIHSKTATSMVDISYANVSNLCARYMTNINTINYIRNSIYRIEKRINDGYLSYGWRYVESGKSLDTNFSCYIDNVENCFFDLSYAYENGFNIRESLTDSVIITNQHLNRFYFDYQRSIMNISNNLFVASKTPSHIKAYNAGFKYTIQHSIYGSETSITNNSFIISNIFTKISELGNITLQDATGHGSDFNGASSGNVFAQIYQDYSDSLLENFIKSNGEFAIDINDVANHDDSVIWPYIKDISILDKHDNVVHTVGTEKNKVRVTFSRDMDTSNDFSLFYGSWEPYSDYQIQGDYVSYTVWEGELQVKANIEGGIQYFSSKGGCAKDDSFKTLYDNAGAFTFNIDTSSAFAMNLQANPTEQGVELTWVQDDYDTLMGYNIYRSESKDGNFVRLNSSVIPAGENTFLDDSCEPGKTYWYTFTVVLSDFSESAPAGKVSATPVDTISPTIYHTPVNQGYANNNLVISCTASDNIAVSSATLYYRTAGEENWKSLPMSKVNDRFSATIYGSEVTLAGLEYYISVTDGRNVVTRGSADSPYVVLVKDASLLDNLGDVDGDGSITTKDALMIIRAINDELILTDDQFHRADLNKDGELSSFEALRILQYVNGKVTTVKM